MIGNYVKAQFLDVDMQTGAECKMPTEGIHPVPKTGQQLFNTFGSAIKTLNITQSHCLSAVITIVKYFSALLRTSASELIIVYPPIFSCCLINPVQSLLHYSWLLDVIAETYINHTAHLILYDHHKIIS